MRHLSMILLGLVLCATSSKSESIGDTTGTKSEVRADTSGSAGVGQKRGKDQFVDADGDGICDGREKGLGLKRGGGKGRKGPDGSFPGQFRWRGGRK
jgi:hypothetical protein